MSVWYKDRTEKNATVTIRMGMFGVLAFCLFAGCGICPVEPEGSGFSGKASNPRPADGAKGVSPDTPN